MFMRSVFLSPERGCRFSWTSLVCPGEIEKIGCKGTGGNVLGFLNHSCVSLPVRFIVKVPFHGFPEVWWLWRNLLDVVTIVDFQGTKMVRRGYRLLFHSLKWVSSFIHFLDVVTVKLHVPIGSMKKYFWTERVLVSQAFVLGLVTMKERARSQLVFVGATQLSASLFWRLLSLEVWCACYVQIMSWYVESYVERVLALILWSEQ
ncbi:hypothetical protein V6N13_130534 [Hibiscus sabdariffa]|uniref:Uncharacterized protein n=1 Tax=Hibiscus sabdariffa TaxID=183260 RepID=A0ABR2B692_9ROSI